MKSKNHIPPKLASRFLTWFLKDDIAEEVEGDLEEQFYRRLEVSAPFRAKLNYWFQVINYLRPFALRNSSILSNNILMIQTNYYKVAFRNIKKDKVNSLISVFGLFLAITAAILIFRVVQFESSYDTFHENLDRIYRVTLEAKRDDAWQTYPSVGPPLGPAIKAFYPEVEDAVRFRYQPTSILATEDGQKVFYEDHIYYADPSIFKVFTYPFRWGDPSSALQNSSSIVLTDEMAKKYFGTSNPIGKTLLLDQSAPFIVTGVLKKIPANSHFRFDFLLPFEAFKVPSGYAVTLDDFRWTSFHTYVKLAQGVDAKNLVEKLPVFAETHFDEERMKRLKYGLMPLQDIYFSELRDEGIINGNKQYLVILSSIGILLLLLAAFNFTNFSVAKSLTRAKETGMRKSLGSSKSQLVIRYLTEPILLVVISVGFSLAVSPYLLAQLNLYFNLSIPWEQQQWIQIGVLFLVIGILIGIVSGIYPALVMSSYKPTVILRGIGSSSGGGAGLQKILVTLQYSITTFLLIGSFIISSQIDFLQATDLGFDKEEILLLKMPGEQLNEDYEKIKVILEKNTRVEMVSVGGGRMDGENGNVPVIAEGMAEANNLPIDAVREDFYKTIGVEMVAGREFSFKHPSDSADGIIINREAAKLFNWNPEEALGKKVTVGDLADGVVIGVVENFHNASLHDHINPLIVYYPRTLLQDIYLRVNLGDMKSLVEEIESDWTQFAPDVPFDFVFMDDHLQQLYNSDIQFSKMVKVFTFLTILISLLGLYGLISLVSQQRIQEISIRKVLGASFSDLVFTLSKTFFILILIANVIAWPLIIWVAQKWLSEFAYHADIDIMVFVAALLITVSVSGITLYIQSRKVAILNPAVTLKQE